jgi:iron complex outermembrane receptor protein
MAVAAPRAARAEAGASASATATDEASSPNTTETIVVTGTRSATKISEVPAAVTVIPGKEVQLDRRALSLEESLKFVPGVRVEDELGSAGRTRIIIRGVGTRANSPAGSGVRGIKILVDGFPKNNAGGSAQDLSNIDLESVDHIEVLRGPSSALYGNQSGGIVNIITEEGPPTPFAEYRQSLGSYGYFREHLKAGGESGNLNYFFTAFRTDQDGWRQNAGFNNTGFSAKTRYAIDECSSLIAVAAFDRNDEHSPGPLTEARFEQDPKQADPTFLANGVRGVTEELRFGATYQRKMLEHSSLELTGYYIPRHLGPFQQIGVRIPQDFMNRGASARFLLGEPVLGLGNRFTVGADFQDTPITTGTFNSNTGAALADLEEHATTAGAYALEELNILPTLLLSAAGRFDWVHFTSEDLTKATGQVGRVYRKFTPRIGLSYHPVEALSAYASFSKGFEAPVIGELRTLPGGAFGFNSALNPQTSTNYEIGARGGLLDERRLTFEIALFRQDVQDLISPIGLFPNNSFQNVGEVRQYGAEIGTRLRIIYGLTASLAYTYSDFAFQNFVSGTTDFSGKPLPGVPQHMWAGEVRYRHSSSGLHAAAEVQAASPVYADNANSYSVPRYTVFNASAGYDYERGDLRLEPFIIVKNLTNQKYSQFALINDAGRRFYNPLPGTSIYGGLKIRYGAL